MELHFYTVLSTTIDFSTLIMGLLQADDGMTALHYAAKAGHVEVLRILLDSEKINVDVTDDGGWTPLIWAVEHDQIEAVKLLLKRNADPNLRDSVREVVDTNFTEKVAFYLCLIGCIGV